ncbi:MAG: DUF4278 domain-containing protein [Leptolyngbyaceae cyanobacterium bins.302]|nr:DUF4278 domain-containing protein [Leptolyngbyaceae cyanobacterium bins.302]
MTLRFLGQTYQATSTAIAPTESELTGQYRGNLVKFSNTQAAPRSNVTLTYRGIRYSR